MNEGKLNDFPMRSLVAAISVGVYEGVPVLDLNYPEDKAASVDSNLVMTENLSFVEMQMSGEEATFDDVQMARMLELGKKGVSEIVVKQREAILAADKAEPVDFATLEAAFAR